MAGQVTGFLVLVKSPYRVVPQYLLMPMYPRQLKLAVASYSDMAFGELID
jgi:hypothetical protein